MFDNPKIEKILPSAAIPGGEISIYGGGFTNRNGARPVVHFGTSEGSLVLMFPRIPSNT